MAPGTGAFTGSYHYFGLILGKAKAVLALVSVCCMTHGAHAAVWLGASSPNSRTWVQAGIEQEADDAHPYAYIEIGKHGVQVSLDEWPARLGERLHVRLFHHGARWRVRIGRHRSRWVHVPHAQEITALETLGDGFPVVAFIDGHLVHANIDS